MTPLASCLFAIKLLLTIVFLNNASATNSRISGGKDAAITEAPYVVSLRYKANRNAAYEHRCVAVIYSSTQLLTTARCVIGLNVRQLQIKAGTSYRNRSEGLLYPIQSYTIHPDFNIWLTDNDLAVVRLDAGLKFGRSIATILLANTSPTMGLKAYTTAWGLQTLKQAAAVVFNKKFCSQAYGDYLITDAMLCVGSEFGAAASIGIDVCKGDAGGPLVVNDTLIGLISWSGSDCGNTDDTPAIYTNVVQLKQWIENETKKELSTIN